MTGEGTQRRIKREAENRAVQNARIADAVESSPSRQVYRRFDLLDRKRARQLAAREAMRVKRNARKGLPMAGDVA